VEFQQCNDRRRSGAAARGAAAPAGSNAAGPSDATAADDVIPATAASGSGRDATDSSGYGAGCWLDRLTADDRGDLSGCELLAAWTKRPGLSQRSNALSVVAS